MIKLDCGCVLNGMYVTTLCGLMQEYAWNIDTLRKAYYRGEQVDLERFVKLCNTTDEHLRNERHTIFSVDNVVEWLEERRADYTRVYP